MRSFFLKFLFNYLPWQFIYFFGYAFFKKKLPPNIIKEINEKKIIFVHIPKNAGLSVFRSIYDLPNSQHTDHKPIQFYLMHKELNQPLKSFAIIRNPWDRFISTYYFFKNKPSKPNTPSNLLHQYINSFETIDEFIIQSLTKDIYGYKPNHFWPQYKYITNNKKEVLVDYILYFETLNEDIEKLKNKLNLSFNLCHINQSNRGNFTDYFTKQTKEIIGTLYQTDIDLFGYSFDSCQPEKRLSGKLDLY